MTRNDFDFEDLIDEKLDFYGVDGNCFKLNDTVYEAVENEADYHSMLDCIEAVENEAELIFFKTPIARIVIENIYELAFAGYRLVDLHDGHEWLRFGTGDYDDYDPYFVFEYTPKDTCDE